MIYILIAIFLIYAFWGAISTPVIISVVVLAILVGYFVWEYMKEQKQQKEELSRMTPEEREIHYKRVQAAAARDRYGDVNTHLICPHCQTKGTVHASMQTVQNTSKGSVGGILKINTATTTQKQVTMHHCNQCKTTWMI